MKHTRILPMEAQERPREPMPIQPLEFHLQCFAHRLSVFVDRLIWFVIAPGALWVAYQVIAGLRAQGVLP